MDWAATEEFQKGLKRGELEHRMIHLTQRLAAPTIKQRVVSLASCCSINKHSYETFKKSKKDWIFDDDHG
jgi:hypothetical protein